MKRILFVDDETRILDGIRRMLYANRHRWDMQFAVGGAAALQALETSSFDVVISDMRMPEMDGITLLKQVRDIAPDTARLILSGYSEPSLSTHAVSVAHQVLSKPCQADELVTAIERVCTLQEVLSTPAIRKIVGTVANLPSLSSTYENLTRAVDNPSTSTEEIAAIIEQDMAMAAKILQLVNSAFFGISHRVVHIQSAVTYLGVETIKNLALTSDIFRTFAPGWRFHKSILETMQQHALRTASITNMLPLDSKKHEIVVISALLHDIGQLILASQLPDQFHSILSLVEKNKCRRYEAEEEMLGTSHAEVGAYLLGLWGINSVVVESIAHHHHPTRISHPDLDISAAIYLADLLAHELEDNPTFPPRSELSEDDRLALDSMGLLNEFPSLKEQARQYLARSSNLAT